VDGTTWQAYGQDLEQKLVSFSIGFMAGLIGATSRRVWIRTGRKTTAVGIAALEDKILQQRGRSNQIWKRTFWLSYGFRQGASSTMLRCALGEDYAQK